MSAGRWLRTVGAWLVAAPLLGCSASGLVSPDGAGGAGAAGGHGGEGGAATTTSSQSATVSVGSGGGGGGNEACAAAAEAQTHAGCEFWALMPPFLDGHDGPCFAAILANTSGGPVHIEVARDGTVFSGAHFIRIPQGQGQALSYGPYDPVDGLPPGEVALVFLSHVSTHVGVALCPVPPAFDGEAAVASTQKGAAFSITTDRPVVGYSMWSYGGGGFGLAVPSASLLLPAERWDTNYIALSPYEAPGPFFTLQIPALAILARENATEVTILPKVPIEGGLGIPATPAGTPVTVVLHAGQYLQLEQNLELTGSLIQSNKPIGVWGTGAWIMVPKGVGAGDGEHQQIPPIRALGSRYAAARHRDRKGAGGEEAPPWRLVGAVDGTVLTWTPAPPPGAPTSLARGELVEILAPGPFVVASQDDDHPFYLAQYMNGNGSLAEGSEGDVEWVHVTPTEQYLDRYLFFTDPTYTETNLVVVRKKSPETGAFADVILDCAGPLTGWEPLGAFEYTRVDLVTGGEPVAGCDNGRHEMASDAPFGVTVWGWAAAPRSYGYPLGAGLADLNDVVPPRIPD